MKIEITEGELGLCIASLELGVRELQEGEAASIRLGMTMPVGVKELANQMEDLRVKLLRIGQSKHAA